MFRVQFYYGRKFSRKEWSERSAFKWIHLIVADLFLPLLLTTSATNVCESSIDSYFMSWCLGLRFGLCEDFTFSNNNRSTSVVGALTRRCNLSSSKKLPKSHKNFWWISKCGAKENQINNFSTASRVCNYVLAFCVGSKIFAESIKAIKEISSPP